MPVTLGQPYVSPSEKAVLQAIETILVENRDNLDDPFALPARIQQIVQFKTGGVARVLDELERKKLVTKVHFCADMVEYRLTNNGWSRVHD